MVGVAEEEEADEEMGSDTARVTLGCSRAGVPFGVVCWLGGVMECSRRSTSAETKRTRVGCVRVCTRREREEGNEVLLRCARRSTSRPIRDTAAGWLAGWE